jgi:hypothetical protein
MPDQHGYTLFIGEIVVEMTRQPTSWTRLLAGAGLLLLAVAVFTPGKAWAACGDYVTVNGRQTMMVKHPVGAPGQHSVPAVPCPCHGPNCSQQPNMPFSPTAPVRIAPVLDWACLFVRVYDLQITSDRSLELDVRVSPIQQTNSIFHPPKYSA